MADQLVTTAQVKARIGIPDAADDTLLGELIDQVSDWIQDFTGRALVPEDDATYLADTGPGSVIPVKRGIRSITALGIASSDQPETGGTYATVALADVVLRPASLDRRPGWPATSILILGSYGRLSSAINGATITGDFGFLATPPAIQGVAIDAVVAAYGSRKTGGASGVVGPDGSAIVDWALFFGAGSPQRATLMRYRAGLGIS